jgi:hypothetical protein
LAAMWSAECTGSGEKPQQVQQMCEPRSMQSGGLGLLSYSGVITRTKSILKASASSRLKDWSKGGKVRQDDRPAS